MNMNPLRLISRGHDDQFEAILAADLNETLDNFTSGFSLIEREATDTANALDRLRSDKQMLECEIADRTERLRQTEVAIRAKEAAEAVLDGGRNPTLIVSDRATVQRGNTTVLDAARRAVGGSGKVVKDSGGAG